MRTLYFLLRKEFRQIVRNPSILRMIMMMPIVQLLIMPLAADYEIKNINVSIVDHDHSPYSRKLVDKIIASGYFRLNDYSSTFDHSFREFQTDHSDIILEIPENFEKDFINRQPGKLFLAANAINGVKALVGTGYMTRIILNFNSEIVVDLLQPSSANAIPVIEIASQNWFNHFLNYPFFMVPGILVSLVTMVGVYMCSLNIVKEKEVGTIEQINVTPIRKFHFILGKLLPFWIIGNFVFTIGLFVVARLVYGIVPAGSYLVLYSFLAIYLATVLGVGLLISTYSSTQQQAMSLAFFCMMIFLLMSGLFTPVDSMPEWAKWISNLTPVTYFIDVMRMVVLKGSGFADIRNHLIIISGMAIFFNGWAIINYKKTN